MGFLFVWADGIEGSSMADTNLHAAFNLSKNGETIALYDGFGHAIDRVNFGAQAQNVSEGRWPDGNVSTYVMPFPTPGSANVLPSPAVLSMALISPTQIALTWRSEPGQIYRVQSKTNLNDPTWQDLPGDIAATNSTSATVIPTAASRSFYRISTVP